MSAVEFLARLPSQRDLYRIPTVLRLLAAVMDIAWSEHDFPSDERYAIEEAR